MTEQQVVDLVRQTLMATFWLGLPLLGVTSMQDSAFGTVPRLAAFLAALVLFLPWMLMKLISFTATLFGDFTPYAR